MDDYEKFKIENFYLFGGINTKSSPYINEPHEFRDIVNLNFINPGSLTSRPGSTMYVGSTLTGAVRSGTDFQRLNGASFIVISANTNLYTVVPPSTITPQVTGLQNNSIFSFVTFVDRLFCANGNDFFKFDGTNNYRFSLPPGATASWGVTAAVGGSMTPGITGTFVCAYGYVNERGYVGPVSNGITLILNGATFNSITYYGLTQAFSGYGITAIQLWRTSAGGVDLYGTTLAPFSSNQVTDIGFPLGTSLAIPKLWFTLAPKYQSIYNNQYFMSGFSSMPSRIYWSEIGEPEAIRPEYYAEFRTNDGDRITGKKLYGGALVVGKIKSLHQIIGDNPSNFALQEISDQYGSLSQQAMCVFENVIWMLDQKGILEFNGARVQIISNEKIQPLLDSMNAMAAVDNAVAIHHKQINEVWFSFPANGSTVNNVLVAYDYVTKSWTRYEGIQPACLFIGQGTQNVKTVFYGGYTGALFYSGSSFYGDNGNAITYMIFSRWNASSGQTTESMYRRFWMDVNPILGMTLAIHLNFFTNYATTPIQATGTIYADQYQTRLDFGLSARTIAVQAIASSASLPFKINSYSFASRFLRPV